MGRRPCCARGAWTALEDKTLMDYIKANGQGKWRDLPKMAGLKRSGKSCKLRWLNYLNPDVSRGSINADEEDLIIRLYKLLGDRWSLIAGRLPGRTDNEIENYWKTFLCNKVQHESPLREHMESSTDSNTMTSVSASASSTSGTCVEAMLTPQQPPSEDHNEDTMGETVPNL